MQINGIKEEVGVQLSCNDEMEGKYLTFWVEGQLYGLSISEVVQIVGLQKITEMPECPDYVKGIINLRGSMILLIDVRARFGKPDRAYDDRTCIIVTNIHNRPIGLIVDEVDEVTYIPEISSLPQMGLDLTDRYLTGIARIRDASTSSEKIVLCLDSLKLIGYELTD